VPNSARRVCAVRSWTAGLLWTVLLLLRLPSVSGQDKPQPVFKSGVQLVAVDVRVTDRDGRPVGDLAAGDFDVTIDGKPRKVESVRFLTFSSAAPPRPAPPRPATPATSELPPEAVYSSNAGEAPQGEEGRLIALLVDQSSFAGPASRAAVTAAQRFLDQLGPSDRVMLASLPGLGPRLAFTTNHAAVRKALERIVGTLEPWLLIDPAVSMSEAIAIARGDKMTVAEVFDRECVQKGRLGSLEVCRQRIVEQSPFGVGDLRRRIAASAYALSGVIEALGNINGPKTVILISAGLLSGERVGDLDTDALVRSVARSAAASRVTLYVLHLDNTFLEAMSADQGRHPVPSFADAHMLRSGLETLAGVSGGLMQNVVAGADFAFQRIAREISASYVLGVASVPTDADGKAHKIQVKVRRPGLDVRSRTELIAPVTPATPPSDAQRLVAVLNSPGVARALPVSLAHVTLRESADRARVILSADIGRGVTEAADINLGYSILNSAGRSVGNVLAKKRLTPVGRGPDAAWSFVETVAVPPGDYTVKFAALDPAGRLGSVAHVIDARAVEGDGISASELLIVDPARRLESGGLSPIADGRITGLSLGVLIEIYPGAATVVPRVSVSIAERSDGPVLTSVELTAKSQDAGRRLTAEGSVDLSMLPPGAYIASANVLDVDRRLVHVDRPFRLEPRADAEAAAATIGPRAAFYASATGRLARKFQPADALTTEALGFFLARLKAADSGASSGVAASAVESIRTGKFDAAIADLRDAEPDHLSTAFLRGLALFARGELEPAAAQFRASLRISSEFLPAVFYLGSCYAAGGKDREAVGAWQTSLVTESDARIVYDVLADAFVRLVEGERALAILTEARERWPDDDLFLPRLAAAQALTGHRGEAIKTLGPYSHRHPDDAGAIMLAARVLFEAHSAGTAAVSPTADRELAMTLSARYRAAHGTEQALLDRWVSFIQNSRVGR
jgi:VWFA-related protein